MISEKQKENEEKEAILNDYVGRFVKSGLDETKFLLDIIVDLTYRVNCLEERILNKCNQEEDQ